MPHGKDHGPLQMMALADIIRPFFRFHSAKEKGQIAPGLLSRFPSLNLAEENNRIPAGSQLFRRHPVGLPQKVDETKDRKRQQRNCAVQQ